jgi:hypothetical protein
MCSKCPPMHASTRLNHGPPHPFKDAGAVTDSLTGIHNAIVKCLFIVNRSCIHKGFYVSLQVKIQRIQVWRAWRPCSGFSSTYPSVMIGVILRTSRIARLKCAGATAMHARITFVLWLPVVHLGIGCLKADVAKHVGQPNSHQQSLPNTH